MGGVARVRYALFTGCHKIAFTANGYNLPMAQKPFSTTIEDIAVSALSPHPKNARTHSEKQIRQIARSITAFGFTNPVLVDKANRIVAGHGRVKAAELLQMPSVPCIRLEHLTEEELRTYIIADNRLAERAGWDKELLAIELQAIIDLNVDFDVTLTGFEMPEIDILLHKGEEDEETEQVAGIDRTQPAATRLGDIWEIGPHRLICGDSTLSSTYSSLLADDRADMIFTDPPYNVPVDGHVSGLGRVKHDEFAMASGEMSEVQFTEFLRTVFQNLVSSSKDGALHFVCMDWRHAYELLTAAKQTFSEYKNLCVWAKNNGGMGSLYRSQHELVFLFKSGDAPHINNVELGRHGRYRTNLWSYTGANSFGVNRKTDLETHPTVKPVALIADAILDCSNRGGTILDPFAGSGSLFVACHRTGRVGRGIELDPYYCDAIVRRMDRVTKQKGILKGSGKSFEEIAKLRGAGEAPDSVRAMTHKQDA